MPNASRSRKFAVHLAEDDADFFDELCAQMNVTHSAMMRHLVMRLRTGKITIEPRQVKRGTWRKVTDEQIKRLMADINALPSPRPRGWAHVLAARYGLSWRYVQDFAYDEAVRLVKIDQAS